MSKKFLDSDGVGHLVGKIKSYVDESKPFGIDTEVTGKYGGKGDVVDSEFDGVYCVVLGNVNSSQYQPANNLLAEAQGKIAHITVYQVLSSVTGECKKYASCYCQTAEFFGNSQNAVRIYSFGAVQELGQETPERITAVGTGPFPPETTPTMPMDLNIIPKKDSIGSFTLKLSRNQPARLFLPSTIDLSETQTWAVLVELHDGFGMENKDKLGLLQGVATVDMLPTEAPFMLQGRLHNDVLQLHIKGAASWPKDVIPVLMRKKTRGRKNAEDAIIESNNKWEVIRFDRQFKLYTDSAELLHDKHGTLCVNNSADGKWFNMGLFVESSMYRAEINRFSACYTETVQEALAKGFLKISFRREGFTWAGQGGFLPLSTTNNTNSAPDFRARKLELGIGLIRNMSTTDHPIYEVVSNIVPLTAYLSAQAKFEGEEAEFIAKKGNSAEQETLNVCVESFPADSIYKALWLSNFLSIYNEHLSDVETTGNAIWKTFIKVHVG